VDILNVYCDLKEGVRDTDFSDAVSGLLSSLCDQGRVHGFRITPRKLGLGPASLPEWHIAIDFENLTQLDAAFAVMAGRSEPIETLHHAVNSRATNLLIALYRDFPDAGRVRGQERF
jgi:hypothetical protein